MDLTHKELRAIEVKITEMANEIGEDIGATVQEGGTVSDKPFEFTNGVMRLLEENVLLKNKINNLELERERLQGVIAISRQSLDRAKINSWTD